MTDALAELTRADEALARAEDIVEVLQIRDIARAIETLIHAIEAGYELEQKATIFRLKAERKAGAWLADNIRPGNPQLSIERTISLGDIGISRWQSHRWQAYATLSETRFHGWIDDALAQGHDVSGAGLLRYAQNAQAKDEHRPRSTALYLLPPTNVCALQGYIIRCQGPLTGQHILNKSKARGNKEIRAILASCPPEVMANVCQEGHNISRWADTKEAQKILLLQKIHEFGWAHMKTFFDDLPWKIPHHDMTLEALLD